MQIYTEKAEQALELDRRENARLNNPNTGT